MTLSPGQRQMLLATALFSLMGALVKHLQRIPAHEVVFFRAWVSLLLCWAMLRRRGVNPWGSRKGLLLARGAAGTVALLLYFHTLQTLPLASAVTIQYLSLLFAIAIAGLLFREGASARQWAGFAVSFAGVVLLKGFDARIPVGGLLLGVLAAAASGLAYNLVRQLRDSDDPLVVVFYFPLVTLPVVGPYTLLHWVWPLGLEWLWLVLVGLLTQAAQVCLTRAYHRERVADVSHLSYLGAVFALALGFALFGEILPAASVAGIAVIVLGALLATRPQPAKGAEGHAAAPPVAADPSSPPPTRPPRSG